MKLQEAKKFKTLLNLNPFDSQNLDEVTLYTHNFGVSKQREFQFIGREEEENYKNWKFDQFTYKLNEHGFRIENMQATIDIGAFGCSYTFGQGLPTDMLWHHLVGQIRNKSVHNFGICGASILTILDIFNIVTKHITMKDAFFLLPAFSRSQIAKINDDNNLAFLNCIPGHKSMFNEAYNFDGSDLLKFLPEDELLKQIKNALFVSEMIGKLRNIKMYVSSWDDMTWRLLKEIEFKHIVLLPVWYSKADYVLTDKARDGRHPGPEHHKFFADLITCDTYYAK